MGTKQINTGTDARFALKCGIDQLADAVRVTLGPRGRVVVIERPSLPPLVSRNGRKVAEEIELSDPLENAGALLVRQVASQTASAAGDGTTTAIVLARAIVREGVRCITGGAEPNDLKRGIDLAVEHILKGLERVSRPVDGTRQIAQVAATSAGNDPKIGELVAAALESAGRDGIVSVEPGSGIDTTMEVVRGMQVDQGYLSSCFLSDPAATTIVIDNPFVLVLQKPNTLVMELIPVLETVARLDRPLLIIANGLNQESLATLVTNRLRGIVTVIAVKAPGSGDQQRSLLEDIAIFTGGTVISDETGVRLDACTMEDFGSARRIVIDRERTTIIEGDGAPDEIAVRAGTLRSRIERARSDAARELLKQQLAMLSDGVVTIRVGAESESATQEMIDRIETALGAARAALDEGVVPGGGIAYLRALDALHGVSGENADQDAGIAIIRRAIEEPMRLIVRNAGAEDSTVLGRVMQEEGDFGYDACANEYTGMIAAGILDPTRVVRVALENAASIAGMILTTETTIVERTSATLRYADGEIELG